MSLAVVVTIFIRGREGSRDAMVAKPVKPAAWQVPQEPQADRAVRYREGGTLPIQWLVGGLVAIFYFPIYWE